MLKKEFEKLVKEAVGEIPEKFLWLMDNVAIVVEDRPDKKQKTMVGARKNTLLLGLYEGVPKTVRGANYTAVLPDKITIFMRSVLEMAKHEKDIRKIVKETVRHEIAHHFGLDEKGARKAEKEKK